MEALEEQRRIAAVHGPEFFKMDESTQQLLEALEQRVRLQLKPIESRQQEMLTEFRTWRAEMQDLKTESVLFRRDMDELKKDLDEGLSSIRRDFTQKMNDRNKVLTPMFAAIAGVVTILTGLAVWYLTTAAA